MRPWFFTFLDGAFRYDCAACGQACCRGKGIAIDATRELVPLSRRVPRLMPLLIPFAGGYVRLPDATDGCWFLRQDGMCEYEQAHGREAKFLTCRLFPFNRLFRAGSLRVVDFNSVICPLHDAYGTGTGVSYRELEAEIKSGGDGPMVNSPLELPEGARELRWAVLEQELLEASAAHLEAPDYVAYAEFQAARTERHLGEVRPLYAETESGFFSLVDKWMAVYGLSTQDAGWRTLSQKTARSLSLLTPSLRFNTLFKRGAAAYRKEVPRMPQRLLATWFLGTLSALALAQSQAAAEPGADHALSLRALTELYQTHAALRDLLARLDEPAILERPLGADDMPAEVAAALRTLSRNLTANGSGPRATRPPLATLLVQAAHEQGLSPAQRALLPGLLLRAGDSLHFGG